jgi:hypothetical protein
MAFTIQLTVSDGAGSTNRAEYHDQREQKSNRYFLH